LKVEDTDRAVARLKAYAACGVDMIFILGLETMEQLDSIHAAVNLPIMVSAPPVSLMRQELAARGVRILLQGHQPLAAAVKALHDTYTHLYGGGSPADLEAKIATPQELDRVTGGECYRKWQRDYLG
jgi:carboxyvinyl-carboxyphosphonate phosphorylmutase